jgi:hypothetical protein
MANNSSCPESNSMNNASCLEVDNGLMWQEKGILVMERYVFLIIFLFGWINNSLSILVVQTKSYRGTSTGFLITVLACADIGVVSTSAAQIWIQSLANYDVRLYSSMGCKWHVFFTYFFVHLSAWILTIITIERVVCVYNPMRVKEIFSLRRTIMACIIVTILLFGINLQFIWTLDTYYAEEYGMVVCDAPQPLLDKGIWSIISPIDLIVASAVPFAIILPGNVIIIVSIIRRATWRRNTSSTDSKVSSTTIMLTVNSIAFILLTAPAVIELTWLGYGTLDLETDHTANFLFYFFHVLFNLNSCLNFVLYSASSSKFRRALMLLVCKESSDKTTSTVQTSSSIVSSISKTIGTITAHQEA